MEVGRERVSQVSISDEMESSYIDYSMSVIVGRALPDVRDGLKPVHRRVLYGMSELALGPGATFKKSARIVGEVLGKYHPHGDASVYDTMVRMAQTFALRYILVDGQGNFGSVDGDSAAAMRYTEARMTHLAGEMLRDLKKNTVDFQDNFDGSLQEPSVLPAAVPNLLINGGDGIAVGMATKIPPHNLGEVVDAIVAYIDEPDIDTLGLMEHLPGPDFPTGGIIYGTAGVQAAYANGRGRIVLRARMHEEELPGDRQALIISEIPYQINKSVLVERIAELVRHKRIDGIADLRDESDRDGMRIVIELKKGVLAQVVQNKLYKFSQCQHTFGANFVALVGGRPRTLALKDLVVHFVEHRLVVVARRTEHQLQKAKRKAHILKGLTKALDHLDAVITIIRESDSTEEARQNLMRGVYPARLTSAQRTQLGLPLAPGEPQGATGMQEATPRTQEAARDAAQGPVPPAWLSEEQANAILEMRLRRLTGLERKKIEAEYHAVRREVAQLSAILGSEALRKLIVKDELLELRAKYADARRTEIDYAGGEDLIIEDLIEDRQVVVTMSHQGLIKRTRTSEFRSQARGGIGKRAGGLRDQDYLEHLFVTYNHDYLLFITDHGQCYYLRVFQVPAGSRVARGRNVRNLIQMSVEDRVRTVLAIAKKDFLNEDFLNTHYVLLATRAGLVKKTALTKFRRPLRTGKIAILVREGDQVLEARLTDGNTRIVLASSAGRAITFSEHNVRPTGRTTIGVRGMRMVSSEQVVGMALIANGDDNLRLLSISANGYGKRSPVGEYREARRGGQGVITLKCTRKTGPLVAIKAVKESDELMIITQGGTLIRLAVHTIRETGRYAEGVRLIRLREGDAVADVSLVAAEEHAEDHYHRAT